MRDDRERLKDVLEAIAKIERYRTDDRAAFDGNELVQTWMVHHIEIVGEAVRAVSEDLKTKHPEVPWAPIVRMRNNLIHAYFGIDLDRVWNVIHTNVPALKAQIEQIAAEPDSP